MLDLVVTLLIIALIAAVLGFGGIATAAVGIAKIVFLPRSLGRCERQSEAWGTAAPTASPRDVRRTREAFVERSD